MRVIDVLSSLPTILFYILLMVALGAGFWNLILAMTLTGWIGIARLVRGQVLSLKKTDYVRASRAMGGGTFYIIKKHILRNVMTPIVVSMALGIPGAMFAEAGLSFLGLGIPAPQSILGTNDRNVSRLYSDSLAFNIFSGSCSCLDDARLVYVC